VDVPPGEAFLHGAHSYLALARLRLARDEPGKAEALVQMIRVPAESRGWVEVAAEADLLLGAARRDQALVDSVMDRARASGFTRLQQLGEHGGGLRSSV
jgi:hypothetical protein